MFTIVIPTLNNLKYLRVCINSIKKNSYFEHEIIPHVNIGTDGTIDYLKSINIKYTFSKENYGICKGVNTASKKSKYNFILYAHDDFYFTPNWDIILKNEIEKINHNKFYLSGTMINNGQIDFNCGNTIEEFNEKKFLNEYKNHNHYDFQGSTWAPHLIHKELWNKIGGFSEEFFPGTGSDPDLNMKLWNAGVRIFKGINAFKVYHFGSIVTRSYKNHPYIVAESGNKGAKLFILKWGLSIYFFKKYFLKSGTRYKGELLNPNKSISFLFELLICKINYLYVKFIYNFNNKLNFLKS